jgi:hypothetical protein
MPHRFIEEDFETWSELQSKLDRVKSDWDKFWYRGHRESTHRLVPKALRPVLNHGLLFQRRERSMTQRFFQRVPRKLADGEAIPPSLPDRLCFAQHYELPTRILDWSERLSVAIYFAVGGSAPMDDPCFWLIDPVTFNDDMNVSKDDILSSSAPAIQERAKLAFADCSLDSSITIDVPACFIGPHLSRREETQSACFSIHGLDTRGMDEIALDRHQEAAAGFLYKLIIRNRNVERFRREIATLIEREADLFPEPQAVSRDVVREVISEAE